MRVRLVVLPSLLLAAVLGLACGDSPSAPSPVAAPVESATPPVPVPDLSGLVGTWTLTVRVTEVQGNGCVAETMRSQVGAPMPYTLQITQTNYNVKVTLRSASGDYACTFSPAADSTGFTTYGKGGFYTCEQQSVDFRCADGTRHSITTFGEDISGRLSGTGMTGSWDASWFGEFGGAGVEMKAQFTGTR